MRDAAVPRPALRFFAGDRRRLYPLPASRCWKSSACRSVSTARSPRTPLRPVRHLPAGVAARPRKGARPRCSFWRLAASNRVYFAIAHWPRRGGGLAAVVCSRADCRRAVAAVGAPADVLTLQAARSRVAARAHRVAVAARRGAGARRLRVGPRREDAGARTRRSSAPAAAAASCCPTRCWRTTPTTRSRSFSRTSSGITPIVTSGMGSLLESLLIVLACGAAAVALQAFWRPLGLEGRATSPACRCCCWRREPCRCSRRRS